MCINHGSTPKFPTVPMAARLCFCPTYIYLWQRLFDFFIELLHWLSSKCKTRAENTFRLTHRSTNVSILQPGNSWNWIKVVKLLYKTQDFNSGECQITEMLSTSLSTPIADTVKPNTQPVNVPKIWKTKQPRALVVMKSWWRERNTKVCWTILLLRGSVFIFLFRGIHFS
jgi:hypothetical protein